MNKFLFLILFFGLQLKAQTVYKTPSGSKYHLASCRMVKNVSSEISLSNFTDKSASLLALKCDAKKYSHDVN